MPQGPMLPDRGRLAGGYFVMTPENFVANHLPHFDKTVARPLATPRFAGANFGQYLLEMEASGGTTRRLGAGYEHFLYQLEGIVSVSENEHVHKLEPGGYCYLPLGTEFSVHASESAPATMIWTKRHYEAVEDVPPPAVVVGHAADAAELVPAEPGRYTFKELLPAADPSFDFAMNVLTAKPGGSIGLVEVHHQEHGLLMLSGRGIYLLAGDFHEVKTGDYIYMAPYCPQSFYALGDEAASYLLYKDVNRDGF